jgi:hypothetical protein
MYTNCVKTLLRRQKMDEKGMETVQKGTQTTIKLFIPALPETPAELMDYLKSCPKEGKNRLRTAIRKKIFLETYAKTWGKAHFAVEAAGMSWAGYKRWLDTDPEFKAALEHLDGLFADQLEVVIDHKILEDKSDSWLLKRLQQLRPDKYQSFAAGKISGNLTIHLDEDSDEPNQGTDSTSSI